MTYEEACKKAASYTDGCVHHVNATLSSGEPPFIMADSYIVSDWTDGTTVASYVDGRRL